LIGSPSTYSSTVRVTAFADPGIQKLGDVRMREPREQIAFATESLLCVASERTRVQKFDGRLAAKPPSVRSAGRRCHATLPDRRDQRIGPSVCPRRRTHRAGWPAVLEKTCLDRRTLRTRSVWLGCKRGILCARTDVRCSTRRQVERPIEIGAQCHPSICRRPGHAVGSARCATPRRETVSPRS
jgi:hypothetical protein